jgi:hypothetical protein
LVASSDRLIRTPALFRRCAISTRTAVAAYGSFLLAEYFHYLAAIGIDGHQFGAVSR